MQNTVNFLTFHNKMAEEQEEEAIEKWEKLYIPERGIISVIECNQRLRRDDGQLFHMGVVSNRLMVEFIIEAMQRMQGMSVNVNSAPDNFRVIVDGVRYNKENMKDEVTFYIDSILSVNGKTFQMTEDEHWALSNPRSDGPVDWRRRIRQWAKDHPY